MGQVIKMPSRNWRRLNLAWSGFFIVSGLANLYVAGQFFTAEQALVSAVGPLEIDLAACGEVSSKELLDLCLTAQSREETWINFKLFGMMRLMLVFVVVQAF